VTTNLADLVRVAPHFQRSVRVDTDSPLSVVEGFICTPTAADVLTSIGRQVIDGGQGAFTLTGSYGTGKSSLAVVLAGLLGGDAALRNSAVRAVGPAVASKLKPLTTGRRWRVVPVNGRQGDPEDALRATLAASFRGYKTSVDPIEFLAAEAADGERVLVLVDEMGKFLEAAAGGKGDLHFFQLLAEAANASRGKLLLIGILHQAFDEYAHRLGREGRDDWAKVQGRFADIPVNLAGEEQVELVARAIEAEGRPEVALSVAEAVAAEIRTARPGTSAGLGVRLADCWPLHPMVACLLGPLSRRRFGQNQRSIFIFLGSAEPFGFQEFLKGTPAASGRTFGPVQLWDYLRANFEASILASPDSHRWSLAVDALERCEAKGGSADHLALVKTVALVDLFKERSGLKASRELLTLALPGLDAARLEELLVQLESWSVVIYRRHLGAYAIYAGSDFDIEAAVAEARAALPSVDPSLLKSHAVVQPVLAKRYYHDTGALHWFDVDLVPLAKATAAAKAGVDSGRFLLLLRGDEGDEEARALFDAAVAAAQGRPIVVGWCPTGDGVLPVARELLCLEAVRAGSPQLAGDAVARREVSARMARAAADVEDQVRKALGSADWTWWAGGAGQEELFQRPAGAGGLDAIASAVAMSRFTESPHIKNELLNRSRPSTNAVAAQNQLMRLMVEEQGNPRLGIDGYPAEGGLFASVLEATGLYAADPAQPGRYRFTDPTSARPGLPAMWRSADDLFRSAGSAGAKLGALHALWRAEPFGVREGLLPVLSLAYLLSRPERAVLYLDDMLLPAPNSLMVDRMLQEPDSLRMRWVEISTFHSGLLSGIAGALEAITGGRPAMNDLDVARALFAFAKSLPNWVARTRTLSADTIKIRDLLININDATGFLLDDLPATFGIDPAQSQGAAARLAEIVSAALAEMSAAYQRMLVGCEAMLLKELRVPTDEDLTRLRSRAGTVFNLTGNFRLDALASRLQAYTGTPEEIEGILALAANKPPRDWTDRDLDNAGIELAALAQAFVKAEGMAHIKGRPDRRTAMAIYVSDPERPSPIAPEFDVADSQRPEVERLKADILALLGEDVPRDIALAAIAEAAATLAGRDETTEVLA